MRIVSIDIETTGFFSSDELLQFGMVSNNGEIFSEYYRPLHNDAWPAAEKVNNISPEMVRGKFPFQYEENIKIIQDIVDNADIIVGYNHEHFDIPFLERNGISFENAVTYDVMKHFKTYYDKECGGSKARYKLCFAAEHFGVTYNMHEALSDAQATLHVYHELIKRGY